MVAILQNKVTCFAFISRVIACILLISCSYLPTHDADAFKPPLDADNNLSDLDKQILKFFDGFLCWDSRYFQFISSHGYLYQNTLVFMPLFPLLSRLIASTIFWPLTYCGLSSIVTSILAGILLNNICFILSAILLYRLGCRVVGDNTLAYKAALIFCFNPASVFFSVFYSESLFFFLTLLSIFLVELRRSFFASVFVGLSTACRSNGLLSIVFLLHYSTRTILSNLSSMKQNRSWLSVLIPSLIMCFFVFVPDVIKMVIASMPFAAIQFYGFMLYCRPDEAWENEKFRTLLPMRNISKSLISYGHSRGYVQLGDTPSWCNESIPVAYTAIQKQHWGLGFLKYYELRQLPNFALAAPVACIAIYGIASFVRFYPAVTKTFGLMEKAYDEIFYPRERLIVKRITPYILHLFLILAVSVLNIHIQVLTRLIFSSSPCIYWILSYAMCRRVFILEANNEMDVYKRLKLQNVNPRAYEESRRRGNLFLDDICDFWYLHFTWKLLLLYIISYFFVGIFLHGNFFPWT